MSSRERILADHLLRSDPREIVRSCREDDALLTELRGFASRLEAAAKDANRSPYGASDLVGPDDDSAAAEGSGANIDAGRLVRSDPKKICESVGRGPSRIEAGRPSAAAAIRAINRLYALETFARDLAAVGKSALLGKQAESKGCVQCKSKSASYFRYCAGFGSDNCNAEGSGTVLCDSCFQEQKDGLESCSECKLFICKECTGKVKCGSKIYLWGSSERDDANGCEDILCSGCQEMENGIDQCDCGVWYCPSCSSNTIQNSQCVDCNNEMKVCHACDIGGIGGGCDEEPEPYDGGHCAECRANYDPDYSGI